MRTKLHYVLPIAIFLLVFSVSAQDSPWKKMGSLKDAKMISKLNLDKNQIHIFELNTASLKESLSSATSRSKQAKKKLTLITIPGENGKLEAFNIYEASVFAPDLAEKYPNIKSYVGVGLNNSGTRLRMSISPQGVQTMISYPDKPTVFMQPASKGSNEYVLYNRKDKNGANAFECKTVNEFIENFNKSNTTSKIKINEGGANDQILQRFRIAISVTAEYTAYHNDGIPGNGNAVADALAAINNTLSRVNEIFETDMAVTFQLINAPQLIYTNAATDPYSNADVGADTENSDSTSWSIQLQNTLNTSINNTDYDLGHLFGASGGGGNAGCIGCVCVNGSKGSAYTSPSNNIPEGDMFDLDFVVHEIGHQMGATHTFSYDDEGNNVSSEPGSGTTIMGYAGITGSDNVQLSSDPYFHYQSIKQILNNLSGKSCQTTVTIANNPPMANAGSDYRIPQGTAYILKGAATDSDGGDNLTYCWEQTDSGLVNYLNFGPDLALGSMNRSLPPSSSSERYIPKFSSVLAGKTLQTNPTLGSDWETVSTVGRNLNWALTVRDRAPASSNGGQSSFDTMQITVENVAPFTVSNPVSWVQGGTITINWVVGQTNNATINCQKVNIKLSTDGGLTFPITIASNTPNDGTHNYTVPTFPNTATARLLVEAADNIFYDVSNFDFSISPVSDFFMVEETFDPIACADNSVVFHFNYVTANGFSENTVFSASGNPGGSSVSFSPTSLNASGSVTMTISDLNGIPLGNYPITITGTSTSKTKNKIVNLPFFNGNCISVASTAYNTSTTLVQLNTINNETGKPVGYNDYKSISTEANRNSAYNLTVKANTDEDYTIATKVWIDWNQNCSFNDAGEEYDLGTATNVANGETTNSPLSITVPAGANLGRTLMRVTTKFQGDNSGLPTACENGFDGEVEDYTINVMPNLSIEEFGFENFIVYPNPNNGVFTVQLNGSLERGISAAVFDMRGRIIYSKDFQAAGDFMQELQLNNVQSGMYLLIVNDGVRKSTKKILIE